MAIKLRDIMKHYHLTNMQKIWIYLIITLMHINCVTSQRQPRLTSRQIEDISSFINTVMSCRRIPGMNLVVVNKDKVLMSKGFGFSNLDTNQRVTSDTLFPIASTTKAFTVTLLAIILHSDANTKK